MTITITLKKPEIDYDIAMTTHVVMNRELAAGATQEQGFNYANTQDETGEVNLLTRYVEKAIAELAGGWLVTLRTMTLKAQMTSTNLIRLSSTLSCPKTMMPR